MMVRFLHEDNQMSRYATTASVTLTMALVLSTVSTGQSQEALARQHFDAARKAAGAEWASAADFFAMTNDQVQPLLPSVRKDPLEPMKVFDNLYMMGLKQTVVWAIRTTAGIVLIDAGGESRAERVLSGMSTLGLDPRDVRYILIAHGHSDHFAGSKPIQERSGARVGMSAADWDFVQPKPGAQASPDIPKRDLTLVDGEALTVGDIRIVPVSIPGHTPGSMGFVFTVKDGGRSHTAALFGGTMLSPAAPLPQVQQYLRSIQHFREVTRRLKADVELLNHPLMDDLFVRAERLKTRDSTKVHPLVVGEDGYQRFLTVMSESMKGQLARRGELTAP
jgi:metallo-beta-lactamase class B